MERGMAHLNHSARGPELSALHLEAGIACQHYLAPLLAETDWNAILGLYDLLYERNPSPVIAIDEPALARYPFYWAARGEIHARANQRDEAHRCYQRAATLARNPAEEGAFLRNAAVHQIQQ
jgi:predicted RNA polymerase sigma factor